MVGHVVAATALAVATAPLLATAATAQPAGDIDEGLWYYSQTGLEQIHDMTTGQGVTIALLDSQINPDVPDLAGTGLVVREPAYCADSAGGPAVPATSTTDQAEHATNMAALVVGTGSGAGGQAGVRGVAPGVSLRVYTVTDTSSDACANPGDGATEDDAVLDAIADGADIITVPGNRNIHPSSVLAALRAGVIVVAAGGNDGEPVYGYPALNNGVVATGTVDSSIALDAGSAHGPLLSVVAPGSDIRGIMPGWQTYGIASGSSASSTYTAAALALAWSAHPEASANQILQALVRTTDGSEHEPSRDDEWGYGVVNIRQLVAVDPTTYPDENPFLFDATDRAPTVAEVLGTPADADAPPPEAEEAEVPPVPEPDEQADGGLPVGAVAGIGAGVLLLAVVVGVVVARNRRRRDDSQDVQTPTYARGNHG
ncbi:S8 family serine peptidase [Cellulomonas sp. Marseille-Q8402]